MGASIYPLCDAPFFWIQDIRTHRTRKKWALDMERISDCMTRRIVLSYIAYYCICLRSQHELVVHSLVSK